MPRKYYPHHYTSTTTSLICWHKAGWIYRFRLFTPNSAPATCMSQLKLRDQAMFSTFYCPVCPQFPVLRWQECNSLWSFAAAAHPLQGVVCSEMLFCIALLSYCRLPLSLNHSGHSPLTSLREWMFLFCFVFWIKMLFQNPNMVSLWLSVWAIWVKKDVVRFQGNFNLHLFSFSLLPWSEMSQSSCSRD